MRRGDEGAEDEAAKEEALKNLDGYRAEFSKFLETATGGRLKSDALAEGLQMHVEQLVGAFNSYAAGDYEKSWDQIRMAYEHLLISSLTNSKPICLLKCQTPVWVERLETNSRSNSYLQPC
jgi:predicted metalloenzyme YecM